MTASWNNTDEVGWPAGADGSQDPEPFRPDWSSFEDSLRAHGFEVVPPAVDATAVEAPAAEGLTSDGMSRAAVEEASRAAEHNVESEPTEAESDGRSAAAEVGAEPTDSAAVAEPTQSDSSAEPVSATGEPATVQAESGRSNDFWSFDTDEPTWIVADDVEDPAPTGATAEPDGLSATVDAATATVDAAPTTDDAAPATADAGPATADAAPATENVSPTGVADEPATAESDESGTSWDFDDADAPVLPDVGQPVDDAPRSVFGEEAAPATAGAVFHADELADEQFEDVSPDAGHENGHEDSADRWWTEPEDVFGATIAVAESAPETEDSLDVEGHSDVEPATVAESMETADEMNAGDDSPEPYVDPTHGARVPQTLPDDRLPTPPPDLVARFAHRGAAATAVAAATDVEAPGLADATSAPEEPAAFVPWTYDEAAAASVTEAETQTGEAQTADPAGTENATWAAADTDAAQANGWTSEPVNGWTSVPVDAHVDTPAEHAGAGDAADWSDWAPMAGPVAAAEWPDTTATDQAPAQPAELSADEAAAPAESDPASDVAVDWYEAAAIEAVGTSSGEELANTEFVGYDAAPVAAAAVAAGLVDGTGQTDEGTVSADEPHDQPAAAELDGSHAVAADDGRRDALGWAVLGAAAATDGRESPPAETHEWRADDEWPEATAYDAAPANDHEHAAAQEAPESQEAAAADHEPAEPVTAEALPDGPHAAGADGATAEAAPAEGAAANAATADDAEAVSTQPATADAEPEAAGVAASTPTEPQPESGAADVHVWPMPEADDWQAADSDAWSTPAGAKPWKDSESAAAAAAVAATGAAGAPPSAGASMSMSTADSHGPSTAQPDARAAAYTTSSSLTGSGLFSRYDTSPALTASAAVAASGATATSPRGESDLWHLVSEPAATAPTSSEKRSFDPVTIFLTVLVAIIIVALLLGLLYTVAPMLTGAAH